MTQTNQIKQLATLSKVCEQLTDVVTTTPIDIMEKQLCEHEQQTADNIAWLDEAMNLLSSVSHIDNQNQAQQIITKIEKFVSKSSNDDYASNSHVVETSRHFNDSGVTGHLGETQLKNT